MVCSALHLTHKDAAYTGSDGGGGEPQPPVLLCEFASFSATLYDCNLTLSGLALEFAALTFTGFDLTFSYKLELEFAALALDGFDLTFSQNSLLSLEFAAFTFTGFDLTFESSSQILELEFGSMAFTGFDLTFTQNSLLTLELEFQAFSLTGFDLRGFGNYDSDAQTWFAAVEATGAAFGTSESDILTNKDAFSVFFQGLKTDGAWTKIASGCFLSNITTLSGALVPFKGTDIPVAAGGLDDTFYDRATGLGGIGTAGPYLSTSRNNNEDAQDDNHMALWVGTAATDASHGGLSANTGSGNRRQMFRSSSNLIFRNNTNTADTVTSTAFAANSLTASSRSSGAEYTVRRSGSNTVYTRASGTPAINAIRLFWGNSSAGSFSGRIRYYSLGASLNLALLESRLSTLFSTLV